MKKNKITLYEQELNPSDIFLYIPDYLKRKLSKKDKKNIEEAFYLVVSAYEKRYEERYLDRMLI